MADRLDLSEDARKLLRLHFAGRPLSMRRSRPDSLPGRSVGETRRAYRELVSAGLMEPVSTFAGGPEALYRLTEKADHERDERQRQPHWFSRSTMARRMRRAVSLIGKVVSAAPSRRPVSSCDALLVFVSDHGVDAVPQASLFPNRRDAHVDFVVEPRVQDAAVNVDAVGRDAAAISFAGNECGALVTSRALPDADLPFWDAELAHSLLNVGFGHVLPFVGRPNGMLCGVGGDDRKACRGRRADHGGRWFTSARGAAPYGKAFRQRREAADDPLQYSWFAHA